MGSFYVDDLFYEHPKALYVGQEAADLYVRGLAWAHRYNTPCLPKSVRLTTRRSEPALHKKLTETAPGQSNPLWHDRGDHYEIHDWTVTNAKSVARREQSRNAAKERWRKHSERNADADADASDPHVPPQGETQCETDALAMPYQPRNQGTKEPSSSSNVKLTIVPHPLDDDESSEKGQPDIVAGALRLLAEHDLAEREAAKGRVGNREAWLTEAVRRLRAEHAEALALPVVGLTVKTLAETLRPRPPDPPEASRRDYERVRPECPQPPGCGGSGWIEGYDGTVTACPLCRARAGA